jgi:hypothetical protein
MQSRCLAICSGVDGLIGAPGQRCKRTIVAVGNPVDALVSSDARGEAQAQHGAGGPANSISCVAA